MKVSTECARCGRTVAMHSIEVPGGKKAYTESDTGFVEVLAIVAVDGTGAWAFDLEAGPGTGVYAPLCGECLMDLGRWLRDGRTATGRHDVAPHTEDVDF